MLSFHNVTKEYRLDEKNTIMPVRGVTLEVEAGEFIIIVGRSGTGKTTLLNLAAGLVKPTSGKVKIESYDLAEMTDTEISSLRRKRIGFVFQFPSLLPSLTVRDNVCLPGVLMDGNGNRDAKQRAGELLGTLGLAARMNVFPRQLSAGETKRVVIARALLNNPGLVLADEPSSDLDSCTETEVMSVFRDFNRSGVTFFIVTHNLDLISFATRAFEMENGNLKKIQK